MSKLVGRPFLNLDLLAAGDEEVDGRERRSDVEGHVVVLRQDSDLR